jgi:hypothetical protein
MDDEIRIALFSILDDKAFGLDGYTSLFFKRHWEIIYGDFIVIMRLFFDTLTLPKCVNATRIALVPKIENPISVNDFRLISYCNVMYKCISKVIVNKLKVIIPNVICPSQTIFVSGHQITNAILLT